MFNSQAIKLILQTILVVFLSSQAKAQVITNILAPSSGNYTIGNHLEFTFTFSGQVNVTGTPRLKLNIGGHLLYANYISGGGTSNLTFRYTVLSGYSAPNGIGLAGPIDLNGGSISANIEFNNRFYSSITVLAPHPAITGVTSQSTLPKQYVAGNTIDFFVTFSEAMFVSNTNSRIQVDIGGTRQPARYISGSGTNTFTYRVLIPIGAYDTNGISLLSPIDTRGSSITNSSGIKLNAVFNPPDLSHLTIDGRVPTITSNTKPANGHYQSGQVLNFMVTYSRVVNVTGNPRLRINVGYPPLEIVRFANYLGGSGTNVLSFSYTVDSSDEDLDGVYFNQWLEMTSGNIVDEVGNDASYAFWGMKLQNYGYSTVVFDNNPSPNINTVTAPLPGTYAMGSSLTFTASFSRPVNVTGTPRLILQIGSNTRYAEYVSGDGTNTLTFTHDIVTGDFDNNGIGLTPAIDLNGGTIKSSITGYDALLTFSAPNMAGIIVDGRFVNIASIDPPSNGRYRAGQNLEFKVNYSGNTFVTGTPRLPLIVGSQSLFASYVSGSGTNQHTFRYTVLSGHNDTDGISTNGPAINLNGGSIKDEFGANVLLNFTATNYPEIIVDTTPPTIISMNASPNRTYGEGEEVIFTATYNEPVTITGTPRLTLNVGGTTSYANYSSGSGSSTITFIYTVPAGALDTNGISMNSSITLNGGSISDESGNLQSDLTFSRPNLGGVLIDGVAPTISSISAPANGSYTIGNVLTFSVTFSETVLVTGNPLMQLNIGGILKQAVYSSGSGTSTISFRYVISNGDSDEDGISRISPLQLNGGTIKDTSNNSAILTFTNLTYPNILVDTTPPTITSVTLPIDGAYRSGGLLPQLNFVVTYNEPVVVSGTPRIHLLIGTTLVYANYISGTGTQSITFRYNVANTNLDLDGITIENSNNIDLNGGLIRNSSNLNATTYLGVLSTSQIYVVLSSISSWYDVSDSTHLTFNGFNVSQLLDKVGNYNLTHSSTGATYYPTNFNNGTQAYISCTSSTSFDGASARTPKSFLAVFRAPSTAGNQYLVYTGTATGRPMVQFSSLNSGGTISFGTNAKKFSSNTWSTASLTGTNLWSSNQAAVRAFSWSSTQNNRPFSLCRMQGELAEAFIFTDEPTAAQMIVIKNYVNQRYGLTFPQ